MDERRYSRGRGASLTLRRWGSWVRSSGRSSAFLWCISSEKTAWFRRSFLRAAMTLATAWWYARKVEIQTTSMTASQVGKELRALLKLGAAFMASGVMMMGVAYAIRIFVTREVGIDAAGLYQCAWAVGGLYVGLILQAMGADFYPRLTASPRTIPSAIAWSTSRPR